LITDPKLNLSDDDLQEILKKALPTSKSRFGNHSKSVSLLKYETKSSALKKVLRDAKMLLSKEDNEIKEI
jgi:hypothetical protein